MATTGRCAGLTWAGCGAWDPRGHWPWPRSSGGTSWVAECRKGPGSCWPLPPPPSPASRLGRGSNRLRTMAGHAVHAPSLTVSPTGRAGGRVPRSGPCVEALPARGPASCRDCPPLACSEVLARPPEPTQSAGGRASPESAARGGKASSGPPGHPQPSLQDPKVLPRGHLMPGPLYVLKAARLLCSLPCLRASSAPAFSGQLLTPLSPCRPLLGCPGELA